MRPDYSGARIHVKQNILLITEPLRIHKTSHKVCVFPSFILHISLLIESNTDFCFAFQKADAWCSLWHVSTWLNSLWNMFLKGYPFGSKDWTKELKLECAYFLGQTSYFPPFRPHQWPSNSTKFHNETHDPKGPENKIYTIVRGMETFYRRHTVPVTSCSEVKYVLKRLSFGSKECTKELIVYDLMLLSERQGRLHGRRCRNVCSGHWFRSSRGIEAVGWNYKSAHWRILLDTKQYFRLFRSLKGKYWQSR